MHLIPRNSRLISRNLKMGEKMIKRLVFGMLGAAAVLLGSCTDSDVESGNGELGFDELRG